MGITARTDAQLDEALTALAEAEGIPRQEIIRRAVLDRYERTVHGELVDQSSRKMIDRWGDVLERLGSD
jgi:predicted transcriptional regulator